MPFKSLSASSIAALILAIPQSLAAAPALTQTGLPHSEPAPHIAKANSVVVGSFSPAAMSGPEISFALPDGRVIVAQRQRIDIDERTPRRSWVGTLPEHPGSIVVLTSYRGVTTGFLTFGAETWELMPGKAGRHLLYQVDDSKLPSAEPVLRDDAEAASAPSNDDLGMDAVSAAAAAGYVHDLAVVYTPAARTYYGQATLESMIRNAVAAANQVYLNSKVNITLNLVALQEVSYAESGSVSTSLADLIGTSDGKLDAAHKLRDSVGADIVTLVSQDSSSCGISYVMRSESLSFASKALNVVRASCLSQHSLAHEIGHLQGNEHDRSSSSGYSGVLPYSYGFRRCVSDGTGFRTVMSYPCSGVARVAWFSNPNAYYNGYATGIAYETSPSSSADNARSMNSTADTIAGFRVSKSSSVPTAPTSLAANPTAHDAVTLKWTDTSATETGFKLERSSNGVDFVEIATLGSNSSSHVDNGVAERRTYYYRARSYNGLGASGYSNVATVTTPAAGSVGLAGFALSNSTVPGCKTVIGKVTLTAPAPSGGYQLTISETLASATAPSTVTVQAGSTTARFNITTTPVTANQSGTVSVRGDTVFSKSLTLRPIGVLSVRLATSTVKGGTSVGAVAKLECPAPSTAISAAVASSSPTLAKPSVSSLTFERGVQERSFTVNTTRVTTITKPSIKVSANGITKSATLTINP